MASRILSLTVLLAAALCNTVQADSANSQHAMDKVIQMLSNMLAKAKQAMHEEEVAYAKFSTWCGEEKPRLQGEIAEAASSIEDMSGQMGKLLSDASTLQSEVGELTGNIATYEADMKKHTTQREKDNKAFLESDKDFGESVIALERAIAVLEKQNYDRTGKEETAEALLQVSSQGGLPDKARSMIAAFMAMREDAKDDPDFSTYAAPEANAYEFQSTSVIDVLKKLLLEFKAKKGEGEKEEMNSLNAYNMVVQDLTHATDESKQAVEDKTAALNEKKSQAGLLQKQIAATTDVKTEDEKMLAATSTECEEKQLSFEEKQVLRKEELEAISKAIEILSSEEAAGAASKYLYSLAQVSGSQRALLQLSNEGSSDHINRRVRDFLSSEASRLHSKNIELLAEQMQADPFAKVKKLISNMIDRLMNEAHADATKEGFCDKEFGESKITRTRLQEEIDALKASIEEGKASISMLTDEIAQLTKEVAEIDTAVKEAVELRTAEKAKNEETIKDAKEAATAVSAAVSVLKEFYAKAATATAFVQKAAITPMRMGSEEWSSLANPAFEGVVDRNHKAGMQTFGDTYTGMQQEAGGVLALLEVIASDFSKLKADTEASEAAGADEHTKFMRESDKSKAVKTKKIAMDNEDKAAAEAKVRDDTADMKMTEDKLIAADRYHEKIVDQCVDKGMTFEERQAARQEEIASLKEALKILSQEDIATLD